MNATQEQIIKEIENIIIYLSLAEINFEIQNKNEDIVEIYIKTTKGHFTIMYDYQNEQLEYYFSIVDKDNKFQEKIETKNNQNDILNLIANTIKEDLQTLL